jgi:hypothetical protein
VAIRPNSNLLRSTAFLLTMSVAEASLADAGASGPRVPRWQGTHPICDVLGLGAFNSVPFNFPGATSDSLATLRGQAPLIAEPDLSPGPNAAVPAVFAGDMGWPFEHGEDGVFFVFNDTLFPPSSGLNPSVCPSSDPVCARQTVNDDLLAKAPGRWSDQTSCIALSIDRSAESYLPITLNGPVSTGGQALGPGVVPGPGFSTGRFMFLLVPQAARRCSVAMNDCASVGGLPGDVCVAQSGEASGLCHFGECGSDPQSPCALRLVTSTLVVRSEQSNFVSAEVGKHVVSARVLDAYRGHFATVAFLTEMDWSAANGVVWVIGRDSFWGTPSLTMSPYLLYHPVANGVLGEPIYFAGMQDGKPTFSGDKTDARPLYSETEAMTQHTSLGFVRGFDGGTWVMLYGGHAQPALRNSIGVFVRPTPDSLFYNRDAGIFLRTAKRPWGPWSDAIMIFNPYTAGQGGYCEKMFFDDPSGASGFQCPVADVARNTSLNRQTGSGMGGEYGAAIVPGYASTANSGRSMVLRWLLSTWNPYRVILLATELSTSSN